MSVIIIITCHHILYVVISMLSSLCCRLCVVISMLSYALFSYNAIMSYFTVSHTLLSALKRCDNRVSQHVIAYSVKYVAPIGCHTWWYGFWMASECECLQQRLWSAKCFLRTACEKSHSSSHKMSRSMFAKLPGSNCIGLCTMHVPPGIRMVSMPYFHLGHPPGNNQDPN